MNHFEFDPHNPLKLRYGRLIFSIIFGMLVDMLTFNYTWGIFGINWMLIIVGINYQSVIELIKLWVNHDLVFKLKLLINSGDLEDYRLSQYGREITHSAIFSVRVNPKTIHLTVYPNGIRNSDNVDNLANDISRIFNARVEKAPTNRFDSITYIIKKNPNKRLDVAHHGLF